MQPEQGRGHYRAEIDGLRAVAVVPVVLFHSGLGLFSGGYVGVDVFFVISGFLITSIIFKESREGTFTLANFYERRVRRIAPALLVVLIAVLCAAAIFFLPGQLEQVASSTLATELFASNIWFWKKTDYFAPASDLVPLLHTWSLAVEEQFYIFFPLLVALLVRTAPRKLKPALLLLFAISFALAVAGVHFRPVAAFYLPFTRTWELMAGAILAVFALPQFKSPRLREMEAIAGLGLIAFAVFAYSARTPFPGLAALAPALGAAAFMHANQAGSTAAGRLLSLRPAVFIGLISYSLYLWHWPIFVFLRQIEMSLELGPGAQLGGIAASVALAAITWRFVERPFRGRSRMGRAKVYWVTGSASLLVGIAAGAILLADGLPKRFSPQANQLAAGAGDFPQIATRCLEASLSDVLREELCDIGTPSAPPTFLIWGDSHGAALAPAVEAAARAAGRKGKLVAYNACPPVDADYSFLPYKERQACRKRNRSLFELLATGRSYDTVILSAYWAKYGRRENANLVRDLHSTADRLRKAGKKVVVLAGVPEPGFDVPWRLALAASRGKTLPPFRAPDSTVEGLRRQVRIVSLESATCAPDRSCPLAAGGRSLYKDGNHPSLFAVERYYAPFLVRNAIFSPAPRANSYPGHNR